MLYKLYKLAWKTKRLWKDAEARFVHEAVGEDVLHFRLPVVEERIDARTAATHRGIHRSHIIECGLYGCYFRVGEEDAFL